MRLGVTKRTAKEKEAGMSKIEARGPNRIQFSIKGDFDPSFTDIPSTKKMFILYTPEN